MIIKKPEVKLAKIIKVSEPLKQFMSDKETFELQKAEVIKNYNKYIELVSQTGYNDLKNLGKRLDLYDAYQKALASNNTFRTFVLKTDG